MKTITGVGRQIGSGEGSLLSAVVSVRCPQEIDDGETIPTQQARGNGFQSPLADSVNRTRLASGGNAEGPDGKRKPSVSKINKNLSPGEAREGIGLFFNRAEERKWQEKLVQAGEIRDAIKAEWDEVNRLDAKYKGETYTSLCNKMSELLQIEVIEGKLTEEQQARLEEMGKVVLSKSGGNSAYRKFHFQAGISGTTYEKFCRVAERINPEASGDKEVLALAACLCVKPPKFPHINPDGIFESLPSAMVRSKDDPNYRIAIKFLFTQLEGFTNVRQIEDYSGWHNRVRGFGFRQLHCTNMHEGVEAGWPGWQEGIYPVFRGWTFHVPKWHLGDFSKELAENACAHFLLEHAEVVQGKKFDLVKFRSVNSWQKKFDEAEIGMKSIPISCPYTPNLLSTFVLSGEKLKKAGLVDKELIGIEDDQIPWWEVTHEGMWTGKYGKNLFKLAFAKELAKARLGKFDTSSGQPVFTLTKAEFIEWYETHLEEQGKTLVSFLNEKLSGGNKDVAKGNVTKALEILLGEEFKFSYWSKNLLLSLKKEEYTITFDPVNIFDNEVVKAKVKALQKKIDDKATKIRGVHEPDNGKEPKKKPGKSGVENLDIVSNLRKRVLAGIATPESLSAGLIAVKRSPFMNNGVAFVRKEKPGDSSQPVLVNTFDRSDHFSLGSTRLGRFVDRPEALPLYKMIDAVIAGENPDSSSRKSLLLECMLQAKHSSLATDGGYVLSDENLKGLLAIVRDSLNEINVNRDSRFMEDFKSLLNTLIAHNGDLRDVLLKAVSSLHKEDSDDAQNLKARVTSIEALEEILRYFTAVLVQQKLEDKMTGRKISPQSPFITRLKLVISDPSLDKTAKLIADRIIKRWQCDTVLIQKYGNKTPEQLEAIAQKRQMFSTQIQGALELAQALRRIAGQIRGEEEGVLAGEANTTFARLKNSVYDWAVALNTDEAKNNPALNMLVAYYCTNRKIPKDAKEPKGFLTALPKDLFDQGSEDFVNQLGIAWKFLAVN